MLVHAQSGTSMGTEFWTAYMTNTNPPGQDGGSEMYLYITSNVNTTGTVAVADGSFTQTFTVTANQVTIMAIPANEYLNSAGTYNKGIHITSLKPIAVYAHIFAEQSSGATLLLPVNTMGKDYYSINYTQKANKTAYSTLMVVATEDSTTVQITPGAATVGLQTTTVSLKKGQVYELLNSTDLTGTRIQSVSSGTSACKKIALFSGSTRIQIGCINSPNNSSDVLFQQVYPTASWGKDYITVPLANRQYDVFRVVVSDPNTVLTVNGQTINPSVFANTMYYEFNSSTPNIIKADKPIQAVQYAVTEGNTASCGTVDGDVGDPEMIYLTPLEQTLNEVTLYSTSNYMILRSYINVLIPTSGISSFTLDGSAYTTFTPVPNDAAYSYAQIPVATGTHNISSSAGFNAIAYGFGQYESYGYAAGANLADLNEFIAFQNPQTDSLQYNGCTNEKYNLQLTLPYQTSQITWNFNDGTTPLVQNNPVASGTKMNGTQTLYIYQYPKNPITYSTKGNYTITANILNTAADPCGSTDQVTFNFNIVSVPVANFGVNATYVGTATAFTDSTVVDTTVKNWSWNFGDGQTSNVQNPQHSYASPGKYTVTETVTDVVGCSSTIQKTINVNIIVGPLNGAISTCQGMASVSPNVASFTITAGSLTAPLVIKPPSGLEVSLSANSGYGSSLSIAPSAGAVNNQVIYVRASATAAAGNINGVIAITSTGVTGVRINVGATVNPVPTVQQIADVGYKNGATTTPITFTGNGGAITWSNDNTSIGLGDSGTGNIPSFVATNTDSVDVFAHITVQTTAVPFAYVPNTGSNLVSVINTNTNAVVSNISLTGGPEGVAVSGVTGKVYVTDGQNNTVSVIDALANKVIGTINVQYHPEGICVSPDGSKVFVASATTNTVSIINANTDSVTAVVTVGSQPNGMAISNDGNRLYVANYNGNSVSVINVNNPAATPATINVGQYPYYVVMSPDGNTMYVSNYSSSNISVVNLASGQVTSTISCVSSPANMAISPDGKLLYVSNPKINIVSVIDVSSGTTTAMVTVGSQPYGISITPDGSSVYVANSASGTVSVIDTKTNTLITTTATGTSPNAFGNFIFPASSCAGVPMNFKITVFPTPPVKIYVTGTIANLNTTYGSASVPSSFIVSGTHTVAPVSIVAPDGFEISTDNSSYTSTIALGDTGTIAQTLIYIRIKSTTPAGTYPDDIIEIGTKNTNTLKVAVALATVQPAPLIIKADNKARPYGYANPKFTFSYSGFVNNDQFSSLTKLPVGSTPATILSDVGTYVITPDSAVDANYVFTYLPGTLTISPAGLVIPNTFTPNGDGINDTWNIKYLDFYTQCTVDIFSRYGQKVYHSVGYSVPWDGTYKGSALPPGTYYYVINLHNGSAPLSGYIAILK